MKKSYIHDQLKLGLVDKLTAEADDLDYCRRIVEEIRRRNYAGLEAVSSEYSINLSPLYHVLETRAEEFLKGDQMPKSCEIAVLELMLSSRGNELYLADLTGLRGLKETDLLELYFLISAAQPEEYEIERLNELIETFELVRLRDYLWDQGLRKFFNARYRSLKGIPETELSIKQIAESISLAVILDEAQVVKRFVEHERESLPGARDMKEELQEESALKNNAFEKLQIVYEMLGDYPCDFGQLREALLELEMKPEVVRIELEGLSTLKDYIRSKGVIGAHEVARHYGFICPGTDSEDLDRARRAVSSSFRSQALKSQKGRVFLRREALYNLHSGVRAAQCFRFSSGYLICVVSTEDKGKHFLFGFYPSRHEQVKFVLKCLSYFYFCESYQAAVMRIVGDYINTLAGSIRLANAVRKIVVALPLALSLSAMVGVLYAIVLGGILQSVICGGGLLLLGVVISFKNGYDEEITAASHEKIPDHVNRHHGQVVLSPIYAETKAQDKKKSNLFKRRPA